MAWFKDGYYRPDMVEDVLKSTPNLKRLIKHYFQKCPVEKTYKSGSLEILVKCQKGPKADEHLLISLFLNEIEGCMTASYMDHRIVLSANWLIWE